MFFFLPTAVLWMFCSLLFARLLVPISVDHVSCDLIALRWNSYIAFYFVMDLQYLCLRAAFIATHRHRGLLDILVAMVWTWCMSPAAFPSRDTVEDEEQQSWALCFWRQFEWKTRMYPISSWGQQLTLASFDLFLINYNMTNVPSLKPAAIAVVELNLLLKCVT